MNIQWFPGHMSKTRRLISDNLKLVDAVIEVIDARIPYSSKNPEIGVIIGKKPRIILLNKADVANEAVTKSWTDFYLRSNITAIATDCKSGRNCNKVLPAVRRLLMDEMVKWHQKGMVGRAIRIMVVGIPNVGKSALINRLSGSKRAKVEDRPGVTRSKQWIKLERDFELLDTPGVLVPKFEEEVVGLSLAFTGAIKDDILDSETLAVLFVRTIRKTAPGALQSRYGVDFSEDAADGEVLEMIGRKRGFLISGGEVNAERTAQVLLDEFRSGKLGRISLELPEEKNDAL